MELERVVIAASSDTGKETQAMRDDEISAALTRIESARNLLSIRQSSHAASMEPAVTRPYKSSVFAASLAQDAAKLYAHFQDAEGLGVSDGG